MVDHDNTFLNKAWATFCLQADTNSIQDFALAFLHGKQWKTGPKQVCDDTQKKGGELLNTEKWEM